MWYKENMWHSGFRCNLICKETTKFYFIQFKKNSKRDMLSFL